MRLTKAVLASLFTIGLLTSSTIHADIKCDPELSTGEQCWHNCKTEDDIKICDIAYCPAGIDCGFTSEEDSDQLTITIKNPDTDGPRVGDSMTRYVGGREVRGTISTRVYSTVGVDTRDSKRELLIFITPRVVQTVVPAE